MESAAALHRLGGVARRSALHALGVSDRGLAASVAAGVVNRIRPGWYALPNADPHLILSVRLGGVLTCGSVLRRHGVWVLASDRVPHVVLPRSRSGPASSSAVVHWRRRPVERDGLADSPAAALLQLCRCATTEAAVASVDSALRLGVVPHSIVDRLPSRIRRRIDTRSESGIESIVRQRLRRLRLDVEPQVTIEGVGRVDFLIGERLVVEVDGFEFHGTREAFERDRARDRALIERGYLVIRVTQSQVLGDWPRFERTLLALVRSNRHRGRVA